MNGAGRTSSDAADRTVRVATLPTLQPYIKGSDFVDHVAAALGEHHDSPTRLSVYNESGDEIRLELLWELPTIGYHETYDRITTVEYGACGVVFLVLGEVHGRRISDCARRGERVDYFLGAVRGDRREMLEVKGTDRGSLLALARQARVQFMESPHELPGFVGAVRFLSAEAVCERVERGEHDTRTIA